MSRRGYRALSGRIRSGLEEIRVVADRTRRIWASGHDRGDDWHVDAVALNLHGFDAGVERLLELIAEAVDEVKPAGGDWHRALLSQMASEIPEVRPAVLEASTRNALDRYRGFRHVVRNVYAFNLDPSQVELLVRGLPDASNAVSRDLETFADWLEGVANDPRSEAPTT